MIRFIMPTDFPGVVAAEGPIYDADRVMDVGFRMLRTMHEAMTKRVPSVRCASTVPELPSWGFFNASIEMAMRGAMEELKLEFDIAGDLCTLEAWPYHAGFSPLGSESLLRRGTDLLTTNGNEPSVLDASPGLHVMRSLVDAHGVPAENLLRLIDSVLLRKKRKVESPTSDTPINTALREEDHAFFRAIWAPFESEGIELVFGTMMIQAKFPHEVFGRGRGPVRIRVG